MRKLILPLVIILLCSSVDSFSQAGISCGTPFNLALAATCTSTSIDISSAAFITGPARLGCGYPSNTVPGKLVFLQFHPSTNNACVKINVSTNSVPNVRMEVALYTGACSGTPPDPLTINTANSMCFADGNGVWTKTSALATWPGWTAAKVYYLRVYIPDAIVTAAPGIIPPQLNVCGIEAVPTNDLCANSIRIDGALIGGENICATGGATEPINGGIPDPNGPTKPNPAPAWVCAGVLQNTVWYKYIVETTGPTSLQIASVNCDGYSGVGTPYLQLGLMVGGCTPATILPVGTPPGYAVVCNTVGPGSPNPTTVTLNAPALPAGTVVLVGMDGFLNANCSYNFFVTNAIPIPIKLKYFGAWEEGKYNRAKWITSFEINNAYFEVQRSVDGVNFESIGRIAGSTSSSHDLVYGYDDNHPPAVAYYRLAQFDLDNRSTYSDVVLIKRHAESSYLKVSFANPVQNSGLVNIATEKGGKINLQVIDVAGRNLSTQVVDCGRGNNTVLKDFSRLPAGNYYLVVTQEQSRIVKPFVKQ